MSTTAAVPSAPRQGSAQLPTRFDATGFLAALCAQPSLTLCTHEQFTTLAPARGGAFDDHETVDAICACGVYVVATIWSMRDPAVDVRLMTDVERSKYENAVAVAPIVDEDDALACLWCGKPVDDEMAGQYCSDGCRVMDDADRED